MNESKQYEGLAVNVLMAVIMFLLICVNYHFFAVQRISIEVYSFFLSILVGALFFFLQKAYSIKYERALEKLSKIPEIEDLAKTARQRSQEVEELEEEIERLEQIIRASATKHYLEKRHGELESRLKNTYDELLLTEKEMESLKVDIKDNISIEQMEEIEKRIKQRERGDFIIHIGTWRIVIPRSILDTYPLGGISLPILSILELLRTDKK